MNVDVLVGYHGYYDPDKESIIYDFVKVTVLLSEIQVGWKWVKNVVSIFIFILKKEERKKIKHKNKTKNNIELTGRLLKQ